MTKTNFENSFNELEQKLTALYRSSPPDPKFAMFLEGQLMEKANSLGASKSPSHHPTTNWIDNLSNIWRRPVLVSALLLVILMAVTVGIFGPQRVLAQAQRLLGIAPRIDNCNGELGAATLDNLNVSENSTCILNGTRIKGNIFVRSNATLFANGVLVEGNIHAEQASQVEVYSKSFVGGNILVEFSGTVLVDSVQIGGNLQAIDNWGGQTFTANFIDGNLQAYNNKAGLVITSNVIIGDLQAFDNALGMEIQDNSIASNLQAKDNTGGLSISSNTIYGNLQCQNNFPPQLAQVIL